MNGINLSLKKLSNSEQWMRNIKKHPFVSMFFVTLLCYVSYSVFAFAEAILNFQKSFDSYDKNYVLLEILITYLFRVLALILGLLITYNIIIENTFKKIHFNMVKIIGSIIIVLPIILIIVHKFRYDALNEVAAFIDKASLFNTRWHLSSAILDSFNEIILGCFIIILSEVFKKGYLYKAENDLTV